MNGLIDVPGVRRVIDLVIRDDRSPAESVGFLYNESLDYRARTTLAWVLSNVLDAPTYVTPSARESLWNTLIEKLEEIPQSEVRTLLCISAGILDGYGANVTLSPPEAVGRRLADFFVRAEAIERPGILRVLAGMISSFDCIRQLFKEVIKDPRVYGDAAGEAARLLGEKSSRETDLLEVLEFNTRDGSIGGLMDLITLVYTRIKDLGGYPELVRRAHGIATGILENAGQPPDFTGVALQLLGALDPDAARERCLAIITGRELPLKLKVEACNALISIPLSVDEISMLSRMASCEPAEELAYQFLTLLQRQVDSSARKLLSKSAGSPIQQDLERGIPFLRFVQDAARSRLADSSKWVRREAAICLGSSGDATDIPRLEALCKSSDPETVTQIEAAIMKIRKRVQ
ncbi:MAG: HEAT repeat domain-containing protein [Planctomycetota bacterium]